MGFYTEKVVLVTGGVGTVGREIIKQLIYIEKPKELRVLDNNESEIFSIEEKYNSIAKRENIITNFHVYVGDVRDERKLTDLMRGVDIVLHLAALKHVTVCEKSPIDAVQTNIQGVQNVINAAISNNVDRVIFTSSDKAVNPTNVMGTSKLMGERLITAANIMKQKGDTIFSSTRFGNVIGSRGSVVPLFYEQIMKGGPVTITDERMSRFVMTIPESARFVLDSAKLARGGEVIVMKMPTLMIKELAEVMTELLARRIEREPENIDFTIIGVKPGEKMYEELMTEEEMSRAIELEDMFAILPAFRNIYGEISYDYDGITNTSIGEPYISSKTSAMKKEEIRSFLLENKIFEYLNGEIFPHDSALGMM